MKKVRILIVLAFAAVVLQACHGTRQAAGRADAKGRSYYSSKFGIELDRESNLRLYEAVEGWLGVKYRYSSCSRDGVDCSGLVCALYREVYSCEIARDTRSLYEQARKVDKDNLREGDILFFRMKGKKIDHVGIYLANRKFVHASTKQGVMISNLEEVHFSKAFKGAGRMRCL